MKPKGALLSCLLYRIIIQNKPNGRCRFHVTTVNQKKSYFMNITTSFSGLTNTRKAIVAGAVLMTLSACTQEASAPEDKAAVATGKAVQQTLSPSTFARFVPERKDDFAWENDLVAFRAYGPAIRSGAENAGVDCWLKRVDYPIINSWYKKHLEQGISYHKDHGEGLDNYHVGSSAGCGSTSLWLNNERAPLEAYTSWEIIEQSPAKTVFVLTYENEIDGIVYGESKRVSIELGNRLYQVESRFTKDGEVASNIQVTVGLTTHDEKASASWDADRGWLMAWEKLGEHGLGTAVMVDPARISSVKVINSDGVKDAGHALIILNTDGEGKIEYQAGYGWEAAGIITNANKWADYLNNTAL